MRKFGKKQVDRMRKHQRGRPPALIRVSRKFNRFETQDSELRAWVDLQIAEIKKKYGDGYRFYTEVTEYWAGNDKIWVVAERRN